MAPLAAHLVQSSPGVNLSKEDVFYELVELWKGIAAGQNKIRHMLQHLFDIRLEPNWICFEPFEGTDNIEGGQFHMRVLDVSDKDNPRTVVDSKWTRAHCMDLWRGYVEATPMNEIKAECNGGQAQYLGMLHSICDALEVAREKRQLDSMHRQNLTPQKKAEEAVNVSEWKEVGQTDESFANNIVTTDGVGWLWKNSVISAENETTEDGKYISRSVKCPVMTEATGNGMKVCEKTFEKKAATTPKEVLYNME